MTVRAMLELCRTRVRDRYPALTPDVPQAHWFEREIAEQWGIVPEGHPWLKPIRFHPSYVPSRDAWGRDKATPIEPCVTNYFRVEGEEIHEVAVGPVHAGIIEPGHFRFQCHGENVLHLEIELGYQHRGIERASWIADADCGLRIRSMRLLRNPNSRTVHYMETLAGDTTIGHATAYASILEALGDVTPSPRAQAIRAIALELERLANHTGDLGALAGDVGFLPTASYCGRLRGDFLNITALLCGNRFGRNLVRPGGVRFDLTPQTVDDLLIRLRHDVRERAKRRGPAVGDALGHVPLRRDRDRLPAGCGPAGTRRTGGARRPASSVDVRSDLPWGIYQSHELPSVTFQTGDVAARAYVRWFEIQKSVEFITDVTRALPAGPVLQEVPAAGRRARGGGLGRGLARRDLPRRRHGRARTAAALQDHRSVVPQLVRTGAGPARPADFRFSAVQQEFQSVLLRTRSVESIGIM